MGQFKKFLKIIHASKTQIFTKQRRLIPDGWFMPMEMRFGVTIWPISNAKFQFHFEILRLYHKYQNIVFYVIQFLDRDTMHCSKMEKQWSDPFRYDTPAVRSIEVFWFIHRKNKSKVEYLIEFHLKSYSRIFFF